MANELFDETTTFGHPQRTRTAAATPFRAAPAAPANLEAERGEGLLTKYRPVGGWRNESLPLAANAGAGLGEATSFRGGAGAPDAVPVMRGMQTTYTIPAKTPTGGAGFVAQPGTGQEFLTPMRAGQEFNRAQAGVETAAADRRGLTDPTIAARRGVFRPEGMTAEDAKNRAHIEATAAVNKNPAYIAQANLLDEQAAALKRQNEAKERAQRGSTFDSYYKSMYGGSLPKEGETAHSDYLDARNWELEHPGEGKQRYQENIQLRHIEPLWTPENLAAHGITIPPEVQQNQDLLRKTMLRFGPRLQRLNQETLGGATSPDQFLTGQTPGFVPGP